MLSQLLNLLKSSTKVGNGGFIASSGYDNEIFAWGVTSLWSFCDALFLKIFFLRLRLLRTEGTGKCLSRLPTGVARSSQELLAISKPQFSMWPLRGTIRYRRWHPALLKPTRKCTKLFLPWKFLFWVGDRRDIPFVVHRDPWTEIWESEESSSTQTTDGADNMD